MVSQNPEFSDAPLEEEPPPPVREMPSPVSFFGKDFGPTMDFERKRYETIVEEELVPKGEFAPASVQNLALMPRESLEDSASVEKETNPLETKETDPKKDNPPTSETTSPSSSSEQSDSTTPSSSLDAVAEKIHPSSSPTRQSSIEQTKPFGSA